MKRVILSVFVAGSLLVTSCKKAKEETKKTVEATRKATETVGKTTTKVVNKVAETVESALEGVTIPKFDNKEVEEHLKNYAVYAKDYIAAKGDVIKNTALAKRSAELVTKGTQLVEKLDDEGKKKFNNVMRAIQAKMAPTK